AVTPVLDVVSSDHWSLDEVRGFGKPYHPGFDVKVRCLAINRTAGPRKKYVAARSSSIDTPRKNAKPRTAPTVRKYKTNAPMSEARSALTMVLNAVANERSAEERGVRPSRTSSFMCSK